MLNTIRVGWRNLWRNARRTVITLAAVGTCTAILVVTYGLMDGLMKNAVSNTTNISVGEVQAHAAGYLADRSIYKTVTHAPAILAAARQAGIGAAARAYGYGLAALGNKSAGAQFWGVDPAGERASFDLAHHVARGSYLPAKPDKSLVLGVKLAKSLHAKVGSRIVVVVQAADGSLGNDLFTVVGILKYSGDAIDRSAAIMHAADFGELFVFPGKVHEVALNSRGRIPLDGLAALVQKAGPGDEVKTWRQLMPTASDMLNLFDSSIWIFSLVFVLAAALGVMNTMLMSTFERIREFGVIRALGASAWRILADVTTEAMIMSLLGTLVGAALGYGLCHYLAVVGLDTSTWAGSYSVGGITFDPIWRAAVSVRSFVVPSVMMCAICLLASIYPAVLAARLDPVRAMNRV